MRAYPVKYYPPLKAPDGMGGIFETIDVDNKATIFVDPEVSDQGIELTVDVHESVVIGGFVAIPHNITLLS